MAEKGFLSAEHAAILEKERRALTKLHAVARELDPVSDAARHAKSVLDHLDELFLLVVVGEVKSGKSAFINALLGEKICPEGPTPVTDRINVIGFGEDAGERILDEFIVERFYPIEILKNLGIVDTPGTNSIIRRHQEITEDYVPRADLILFVTSIDRPLSESERQFLSYISKRWRRKIVVVLTKIDTREPDEVIEVEKYLEKNIREKLDIDPLIFSLSAKLGQKGKADNDPGLIEESRLTAMETYIRERLTEEEKLRLKLLSPVNAGLSIAGDLDGIVNRRKAVLEEDYKSLTSLDSQVARTCQGLNERTHRFITQIYDILREFERRGKNFLEDKIRVTSFNLLRKPDKFKKLFEEEVVADLRERVDEIMQNAVDWLMQESIGLFEKTSSFLVEHTRKSKESSGILGLAGPAASTDLSAKADLSFDYNRAEVFATVREGFEKEIARFDVKGECNRVLNLAYRGILHFFGVELGAVSVGVLLTWLFHATLLDVSGVLLASAVALTGFFILPAKKRRIISEFSARVDKLAIEFRKSITREFDREIQAAFDKIRKGYEPYMNFYRTEKDSAEKAAADLEECRQTLEEISGSL